MTRKIFSSVMCFLLVASTLVVSSCAEKNPQKTTGGGGVNTTPVGEDTPAETPNFEQLGYEEEQRTVTFAFCEGASDTFTARSIAVEDSSSNNVDNALYKRNKQIQAQLGVIIEAYQADTAIAGLEGKIGTQVANGEPDYDVIAGYGYFDMIMATKSYVLNLADLKDDDGTPITYLDYTKEYWGTDYINSITYKDIVYWVTGDLSLRFIGGIYCTFVNERLYKQYCEPEFGNIYQIVKDNKWTMDMLTKMAAKCYEDGGISGEANEKVDDGDIVGFVWGPNDPVDGIAFGCKVPFSTRGNDGSISLTFKSSRTQTFVQALDTLLHGKTTYYIESDADSKDVMTNFAQQQSMFTINKVFMAENYLLDMEDKYYIIPTPMLNEQQGGYVSGLHDGVTVYGITWGSDAKAAAAATLEWMAYLSHKDVLPEYYNVALKNSYTTDQASQEMIDLIHNSVNTDFVAAWSNSINNIVWFFRTNNKANRFTSTISVQYKSYETNLEKLLGDLEAAAEA